MRFLVATAARCGSTSMLYALRAAGNDAVKDNPSRHQGCVSVTALYHPSPILDIPTVVVVRNPVERAYSCWSFLTRIGKETRTLREACESSNHPTPQHDYIGMSRMSERAEAFSEFGFLVLRFENIGQDFFREQLSNSLGVDVGKLVKVNPGGVPRFQCMEAMIRKAHTSDWWWKKYVPFRDHILTALGIMRTRNMLKSKIPSCDRHYLNERLGDEMEALGYVVA